jgi:hypothetical protein
VATLTLVHFLAQLLRNSTCVIAKAGAFPACLSWPDRPGKQIPNSHGIASLAEVRSLARVPAHSAGNDSFFQNEERRALWIYSQENGAFP